MRERARHDYLGSAFFLDDEFCNESCHDARYSRAERDDQVGRIGLRREKIAYKIGQNADNAADYRAVENTRHDDRQILEGHAEESRRNAEVHIILAENSDQNADRRHHRGGGYSLGNSHLL